MYTFLNLNDVLFNYYFLIGGLFLSYLVYRILHSCFGENNYLHTKYKSRGHTWRSIQCNKSVPYNTYCTVCGELMLPLVGLFCECCAVSACKRCRRVVDKKFRCKQITWPADKPFHHHWVHTGTNGGESSDSVEDTIKRFYCCWCQRTKLCNDSAFNDSEVCDFQKYRRIIIPPPSVQIENGAIIGVKPLLNEDWEPLFIFANRKSGSNGSDEVLSLFRGLLNPVQVVDMSVTPPERVVSWMPERSRVLVAGGDGTVAWALGALSAAPHIKAAVAILPMGTGNDLSRVLGWGAGGGGRLDAPAILHAVAHADQLMLDRWKVKITPTRGRLARRRERVLFAYNYASIGVDAQVALDFHHARSQFLYRYASRTLNYIAYVFLGAGRALDDGGCGGLERRLRVWLDGAPLPLPPLQALVALNIPSWGAGVQLWSESLNTGQVRVGRALDGGSCGGLERRLRVWLDGAPLPLPPLQALVALNIPSWGAGVQLWSESLNTGQVRVGRALDGGSCGGLERRLRVWLDGAPLPLPPLQALVVLNIPSWGTGVHLWSMGNEGDVEEQKMDDGKVEVVGISSSFHIARLQCGLAEPYRFAQASKIKIELTGSCAMQVDGEPWMQGPATIALETAGQVRMLRAPLVD